MLMLRRTRKLSFQPSIWSNYICCKDDNHDEEDDDEDEEDDDEVEDVDDLIFCSASPPP